MCKYGKNEGKYQPNKAEMLQLVVRTRSWGFISASFHQSEKKRKGWKLQAMFPLSNKKCEFVSVMIKLDNLFFARDKLAGLKTICCFILPSSHAAAIRAQISNYCGLSTYQRRTRRFLYGRWTAWLHSRALTCTATTRVTRVETHSCTGAQRLRCLCDSTLPLCPSW